MKKLLAIVLMIIMAISIISCQKAQTEMAQTDETAQESTEEPIPDWEYDSSTKTLYVNADMGSFEPNAPDFEGTSSNAPWAENLPEIEYIMVSDDVTFIGDYALAFCSNLKSVIVGKNVESLNFRCFFKCGDFENDSHIDMFFNSMPEYGEDVFGYTWDNPNVIVYVPDDMKDYWAEFISRKGEMQLNGYDMQPEEPSYGVDNVLYSMLWNPQWLWGEGSGGFAENQGGEFGAGVAEKRYNENEGRLEVFTDSNGGWMPFNTRLRDCGPDNRAQQAVIVKFQPENVSLLSYNFIGMGEFAINFEEDGLYFIDVTNFWKTPFSDCVPNNFELKSDSIYYIFVAFDADANVRAFVWEEGNEQNQAYYETSLYQGADDIFESNWKMVIGFGQNEQLNIYEYWIYTFDNLMEGMPYVVNTGDQAMNGSDVSIDSESCGPSWAVNICGNFDIISDMVWQSVAGKEVELNGDTYIGYQLAEIMNFSGNPYDSARVIFDGENNSIDVWPTSEAYIVFKKNDEFLGGPFLLYDNQVTEHPIIQVEQN